MTYQGHLPNGNPVQQHSAGEIYPLVIMQKGLAPNDRYGILYGGYVYEVADSFDGTMQAALKIRQCVALKDYEEALQERAELYAELCAEEPALADQSDVSVEFLEIRLDDLPNDDSQEVEFERAYNALYEYVEAGCFLDQEVAGRMLKLSVHDSGMFLKDFRDDRFVHTVYPSMNTAGTVAQIMWRLFPNEYTCNFADWRGVVGAWLLHCGEPILNWQNLAMDTWQNGAYLKVKSWQDLCALLNAVTSKD